MPSEIGDFQGLRVKFDCLVPFGFEQEGDLYTYREVFMDGDFEARIEVKTSGEVTSQVWDLAMDEPYLALQVARAHGPFVGQVREGLQAILAKLIQACFEALPFRHPQTNHLTTRLTEVFGDHFDQPFQRDPDYRSYRVVGKWYALIFPLKRGKLTDDVGPRAEELVEVVNLKVDPKNLPRLTQNDGIFPSYHMSKTSWVSVLLDGTLDDDLVWALLVESRRLVDPYGGKAGSTYWVQPANLTYYDIDAAFAKHSLVTWEQKGKIAKGDWVAIYITAPTQALRYLCQVTEANAQTITLKLRKTYTDTDFPLAFLQAQGLKSVRSLRRLPVGVKEALVASLEASGKVD